MARPELIRDGSSGSSGSSGEHLRRVGRQPCSGPCGRVAAALIHVGRELAVELDLAGAHRRAPHLGPPRHGAVVRGERGCRTGPGQRRAAASGRLGTLPVPAIRLAEQEGARLRGRLAPSAVPADGRAPGCRKRQDRTTTSGQPACATPMTLSARPICPPSAISSTRNHARRQSIITATAAETAGRSPHGTEGPRAAAVIQGRSGSVWSEADKYRNHLTVEGGHHLQYR